jgi:hypothetical protein
VRYRGKKSGTPNRGLLHWSWKGMIMPFMGVSVAGVMTTLKFRKYSGRERTRLADELDIGCK